jgi:hypothetical protein
MQDMTPERRLYAAKGTPITCVRGHTVCHVSHDVYVGDPHGNIFADWQQSPPDKKLSVHRIRCRLCRGAWIRGRRPVYQLHFAEGWR